MQQPYPEEFTPLLEVFRICLVNTILDKQQVIVWADKRIEQEAEPTYFLIELSLCGRSNVNDMVSILNNCVGENKPQVAGRAVLGYLYQGYITNRLSLQKVVRTIYWLALHGDFMQEEQSFMYGLDDEYELAAEGVHGTIAEVESQTLRFLIQYKDFHLENWQQWNEINNSIPDKVQALYQRFKPW